MSAVSPKNAETTKAVCARFEYVAYGPLFLFCAPSAELQFLEIKTASLAPEREDRFPVVLHVHDDPAGCRGGVERLVELADR